MTVRRTTLELDSELVEQATGVTGTTLRATVEAGLRYLVERAEAERGEREVLFQRHLSHAKKAIDTEVLRSGEAWR
jgi:Arc/MetJ family transcription regulator